MSLEADLAEWARYLSQGCQVGSGYPAESCIESLAIPFKHCQTAEEQYEDFMSTRAADEQVAIRINRWVDSLYEPMRTVIRFHYVVMPDDSRKAAESPERFAERRARLAALESYQQAMERYRGGFEAVEPVQHTLTAERYEAALSLAMDVLRDIEKRWMRGP
jgi:hypothetical protein